MDAAGYDDDVWFKFTPVTGQLFATVDFVSTGGDNNFVAQIYTSSDNTCSGTLALFACSEDSGPITSTGLPACPLRPEPPISSVFFLTTKE
ncbi:MAG: hypothetical protein WDO71_12595 [Bacteroidota bacterium]